MCLFLDRTWKAFDADQLHGKGMAWKLNTI